ncbi:hypothetical protein EDF66_105171 [Sphingobacterium sp. JUb20]|nr:hypothetical protein [Sphingobacterium sp. JUb21]TCR07539.1 hypothetical protein EDF66_105171 [Sphingobacterium sp. JUb20]
MPVYNFPTLVKAKLQKITGTMLDLIWLTSWFPTDSYLQFIFQS